MENSLWRYQIQTTRQIYDFLESESKLINIPKQEAFKAIRCYQNFCDSFIDHKIPFNFGIDCIEEISINTTFAAYAINFNNETYYFSENNVYDHTGELFLNVNKLNSFEDVQQPIDNNGSRDWMYQQLSVKAIYDFFEKENIFDNTVIRRYEHEFRLFAVQYYCRCCSYAPNYKINILLGVQNIAKIYFDPTNPYSFKFVFRDSPESFSYIGYSNGIFERI